MVAAQGSTVQKKAKACKIPLSNQWLNVYLICGFSVFLSGPTVPCGCDSFSLRSTVATAVVSETTWWMWSRLPGMLQSLV